jgi:hypothetical protein
MVFFGEIFFVLTLAQQVLASAAYSSLSKGKSENKMAHPETKTYHHVSEREWQKMGRTDNDNSEVVV